MTSVKTNNTSRCSNCSKGQSKLPNTPFRGCLSCETAVTALRLLRPTLEDYFVISRLSAASIACVLADLS
jgi:hypothetical protein